MNTSANAIVTDDLEFTASSGNIFEDIGLPDAGEMLIKAELANQIALVIKTRHWTQAIAADRLKMSQPKLSEMLRGKYRGISQQKMVEYLNLLGHDVEIVVKKISNPRTQGHTKVVVIEPEYAYG